MKAVGKTLAFVGQEIVPILLLLLTFCAFFFLGGLLDILLSNLPSLFHLLMEGEALPPITAWVLSNMAGERGLTVQIMNCFSLLLVTLYLAIAVSSNDTSVRRIRFLYAFAAVWLLAIVFTSFVTLAGTLSFHIGIGVLRDEPPDPFSFRAIVGYVNRVLLAALVLVPGLVLLGRARRERKSTDQPPPPYRRPAGPPNGEV